MRKKPGFNISSPKASEVDTNEDVNAHPGNRGYEPLQLSGPNPRETQEIGLDQRNNKYDRPEAIMS